MALAGRSLDRGPCPLGYSHVLDGYRSCALDTPPCAQRVIDRPVEGVFMEECGEQCGDGCVAVSLFTTKECWLYSSLAGEEMHDEQSVLCARDPAKAPALVPAAAAPARHWPVDPAAAAAVAPATVAPTAVTPAIAAPVIVAPAIVTLVVPAPAAPVEVMTTPSAPIGVVAAPIVLPPSQNAGSDIRLAGGALMDNVPPGAVLALMAGAWTGTAACIPHVHCECNMYTLRANCGCPACTVLRQGRG